VRRDERAERAAQAALAKRAEEFARHERELRDLIAEYHRSYGQARRVRKPAEEKISAVRKQAQAQAAGFKQQARAALARTAESGEGPGAVAKLLGLRESEARVLTRAACQSAAVHPDRAEPQ
jgi:hypothetical protein